MSRFILLSLILILFSCNKIASNEKFSVYRKIDDKNVYLLEINGDERQYSFQSTLKIDINTLQDLGEYLIDINRVYRKYDISDGTILLQLDGADRKSFCVFKNSIYAKDRNHVFEPRNGIILSADVKTFTIVKVRNEIYGRDRNHYFFWNKIVTDTTKIFRK